MEVHKNAFLTKPQILTYWRNPTKENIKFGHGAIHYKDFDFDICFDKNNLLILKAKASYDGLIYYSADLEYFTNSKSKVQTISVL
jgi:hypothetical protein